jgi:putative (di)nucleoside polyphosphate hydrolase
VNIKIFFGSTRDFAYGWRPMDLKFRPNVAGILQRPEDGRILIGERLGVSGAWQFPQGGIDKGETPKRALFREMEEEIGLNSSDYEIVEKHSGYRYQFPSGKVKWGKFVGQDQTYFLCRFSGEEASIRLDRHKQEFTRVRWILPAEFDLAWVPDFKRAVYRSVLSDFFGIG